MQNWGCCVLSGVLPVGLMTGRQQAQEGWWMQLLPLLSLTSHPPPSVSPPAQTPGTAVSGRGQSLPRRSCSSQLASTSCHWFRFLSKGLGCNPWLLRGGGDRPFPLLCFVCLLHGPPHPWVWVLISGPFYKAMVFLEKDISANNLKNPIKIRSALQRDISESHKHHKLASPYCSYFLLVL